MPKRPTLRTREAEKELLQMLENPGREEGAALPSVRALGEQLGLSFATVSRLLQRFVLEGKVWQHPNGRYFPAQEGSKKAEGLPIVLIGRQIQHWSRLYQEILEGVSEICAARGCPLIFLSSDKLVSQESPAMPPVFASRRTQREELERLIVSMPRLCGGILFDHLWDENLIADIVLPSAPRLMLARQPEGSDLLSVVGDFTVGARLLAESLARGGCKRVYVAVPFRGDQMIDAAGDILRQVIDGGGYPFSGVEPLDCSNPGKRAAAIARLARLKTRAGIICTEDNVASLLWDRFREAGFDKTETIHMASMQGTGVMDFDAPITRLRYDYHQLGREAVFSVLERRRESLLISPKLIECGSGER